MSPLQAVVCTSDRTLAASLEAVLRHLVPGPVRSVASPAGLAIPIGAQLIVFTDTDHLDGFGAASWSGVPVIALADDTITRTIEWLHRYPWLSHVLSSAAVIDGRADLLLPPLIEHLTGPEGELDSTRFLGNRVQGRRVRLYRSQSCEARLDRIAAVAVAHGAGARTAALLRDLAGELLSNAFYDAPYEAGAVPGPIDRTVSVALSPDRPCELVYGRAGGLLFVRVRDSYGSFKRTRLIEVLTRCARAQARLGFDESRGGAGLGLWRVFKGAWLVVILVQPWVFTEVLIGMPITGAGPEAQRGRSTHLFFREADATARTSPSGRIGSEQSDAGRPPP